MSHYTCPECSGSTTVVETRMSGTRVRRRRKCSNGHRITTLEIPHSVGKELIDLIRWLVCQKEVTDDIADYAVMQVGTIVSGVAVSED